jgi:adenylate cyclase class 2
MATNNKEVEIKFRIANLPALTKALRSAGFRLLTPRTQETNTLYDLPGQKLRRKGQLIRLRQYGSDWVLTYKAKGKTGRHKTREEIETKLADGKKLDAILHALGYAPSFRYEKFRAEWADGKGHVVLDETPIGNFGEIEGPPRWIDQTAKVLGIAREQYVTQAYTELFYAWKRSTGSPANEMTFKAIGKRT